jgi:transposase
MLTFGAATRVYLAAGATDLRRGFDGLAALAAGVIGADPLSGHVFVFCNRSRTRLKVLFWDRSGLWVCAKRLEGGKFSWPGLGDGGEPAVARRVELSAEEFALLVGGMEMARVGRKRWWRSEGLGTVA